MFNSPFVLTGFLSEPHMLQKTFRLSILTSLLCSLIFFVLKRVNSLETGQDLGTFIPEGPEDEDFVFDVLLKVIYISLTQNI